MSKIKEALELSVKLNQQSGGWSHHRQLFNDALSELETFESQRDTAWAELREIREAIKADENESTADMVRFRMAELFMARRTLEDHGPEGHNVTNQQYVELRNELDSTRDIETVWEKAMMAAIGEDGPVSVSCAIGRLKEERDELLAALIDAGNDYISQNGSKPSWWTDDIAHLAYEHKKEASHVD
jgi:hypothetical protein